jgi:hypothetical protein
MYKSKGPGIARRRRQLACLAPTTLGVDEITRPISLLGRGRAGWAGLVLSRQT